MFREPEENLSAFGWPWHGLIEGSELTLPSGRVIPINQYSHEVWLWDVGLPDPEITAEDPDELWLNKAIIRGITGSRFYRGYARAPIRMAGETKYADLHNVIGENGLYPDRGLAVEVRADGVVYTSNALSWADVGMPDHFGALRGQFRDVGFDGARWVISISAGLGIVAFAEAVLAPDGAGYAMTLSVIADYADTAMWTATVDDRFIVPLSSWIGWLTTTTSVTAESTPGLSYYSAVGEYTAHAVSSVVIGAWYGQTGTAELVSLNIDATLNMVGEVTSYYAESSDERRSGLIWLSAGGAETAKLAFAVSVLTENLADGSARRTVTYDNDTETDVYVYTYASHQPIGRATFLSNEYPSWSGEGGVPVTSLTAGLCAYGFFDYAVAHKLSCGYAELSNRLSQPTVRLDRSSSTTVHQLGEAISPHGADAGVVVYDTASGPAPPWLYYGSYNPITGQVIRNQTTPYNHSWI